MQELKDLMIRLFKFQDVKCVEQINENAEVPELICGKIPCNAECCATYTSVLPYETLMLYDPDLDWGYIKEIAKIRQNYKGKGKLKLNALNTKCVFLVDNKCTAYKNRPFNCRMYYSYNRNQCANMHIENKGAVFLNFKIVTLVLFVLEQYSNIPYNISKKKHKDHDDIHQSLLTYHEYVKSNKPVFSPDLFMIRQLNTCLDLVDMGLTDEANKKFAHTLKTMGCQLD